MSSKKFTTRIILLVSISVMLASCSLFESFMGSSSSKPEEAGQIENGSARPTERSEEQASQEDDDGEFIGDAAQVREESDTAMEAPMTTVASAPKTGADNIMPPPSSPPNDEPYEDNFFENYGVNPSIDTEDDHLSTFALDVDTGSYTITRRYLADGHVPDKDSVRVEEFVNYFDQGYEAPEDEAFAIFIDGGPAPFTESERYEMLRVGVQGYSVSAEERKDVALTFVIDVSGSMDMENRLELVKDALGLLVEQLDSHDTVSIVVYGDEAHTVLEPTSARHQETIMSAIRSLEPEGSTNAADGIRLGYKEALLAFNPDGINRVILCSDGVANVGDTAADSIWDSVKAWASEGITLTTVGFGMGNYNDVLMEQLADQGEGFYAYVDDIKEAERIFVTNLTSTLQVIAMDAKVQVDFNPDTVERYRLVGFENRAVADEDFRNDKVDAGEVGASHSVTALYEIKLHPGASGRVATVLLRWEDPESHDVTEISRDFKVDQMYSRFSKADEHFQWDVLVAEFAEVLRLSYWAQETDIDELYEEVERVSRLFEGDEDIEEFVDMLYQVDRIILD